LVALAGARRYWLIWVAVVPVALWALVRSLGREGDTALVPLLAFTPYVLVVAFFVAGIAAALGNWAAAAVAAPPTRRRWSAWSRACTRTCSRSRS